MPGPGIQPPPPGSGPRSAPERAAGGRGGRFKKHLHWQLLKTPPLGRRQRRQGRAGTPESAPGPQPAGLGGSGVAQDGALAAGLEGVRAPRRPPGDRMTSERGRVTAASSAAPWGAERGSAHSAGPGRSGAAGRRPPAGPGIRVPRSAAALGPRLVPTLSRDRPS